MSYRIAKEFAFSASHVLDGLPEGHQCGRLHGHNYVVELELSGEVLDERGFVLDYGDLAPFKRYVDETLDHRHLNDVFDDNPTAEHMARDLFWIAVALLKLGDPTRSYPSDGDPAAQGEAAQRGVRVTAVRIHETPKTVAEYRPR